MRSIDDQGLSVFEALRDVEVAAVADPAALSLEHLDDFFSVRFSLVVVLRAEPQELVSRTGRCIDKVLTLSSRSSSR